MNCWLSSYSICQISIYIINIHILVIRHGAEYSRKDLSISIFNVYCISDIFIFNLLIKCPICYKLLLHLMNISYSKCLTVIGYLFLTKYSKLIYVATFTIYNPYSIL